MSRKSSSSKANRPGFGLMALLLLGVLGLLLGRAWLPGQTLFSNDGPLGRLMSDCHQLPSRFFGCWQDLNSIGYREGSAVPGVSYGLEWVLGPLGFSKFYASVALFFLGASAWCLFRQWRLAPAACLLGGLAASLNSTFFSAACWGVAAHAIAVGMGFLALAALARVSSPQRWLRVPLAGFALGIAVVEGADVGAIFSLLVATFVCYQAWVIEGSSLGALGGGLVRVAIMAVCAVALAASSVGELLVTNVEGVVAAGPTDTRSDQGHWDWATQWSLPKTEALGLVVPGLFGYRTDTPQGGNYWGATGRHPAWDRYFASGQQGPRPTGLLRFVGGGNYAGIAVVLVALWAVVQSFRKKDPLFDASSRKLVWFWSAVALVSLLMAFGRFAPFYRLLYALPYFSTIRNPVKFVHVFSLALVVLFALGVDGLWRGFFLPSAVGASKSAVRVEELVGHGRANRETLGGRLCGGSGFKPCGLGRLWDARPSPCGVYGKRQFQPLRREPGCRFQRPAGGLVRSLFCAGGRDDDADIQPVFLRRGRGRGDGLAGPGGGLRLGAREPAGGYGFGITATNTPRIQSSTDYAKNHTSIGLAACRAVS